MKIVLIYFLIILDVVMFPFSCVNDKKRNEYFFIIDIVEENANYQYYKEYISPIPTDGMIYFPSELENLEESDFVITGWYVYLYTNIEEDAQREEVQFPYQIQEEDYLGYYRGHRQCVVFMANWEYIGNV